MNKKRYSEKVQMKKTIKAHQEKKTKGKKDAPAEEGAVPAYLLDREHETQAKNISSMVKQKRKEKAGKWEVPIPAVKMQSEAERMEEDGHQGHLCRRELHKEAAKV